MLAYLKYLVTGSMIILLAESCKQRSGNSPHATELRHIVGVTSVQPEHPLTPCTPATDFTDAAEYFEKIGRHLMTANPATFKDGYAPEHFCFHVHYVSEFNAGSSSKTRRAVFDTGLLFMADDQVDADIAMVVAHELAHITLQHGAREALPSELPDDIDRGELDRRMRLRAVFADQKLNLRKSIAANARTDGIYDDYIWLVTNLPEITAFIQPRLSPKDALSITRATEIASKLRSSFAPLFDDDSVKHDGALESSFIIQSRELIRTLTEDIPAVATAIKTAGTCQTPRDVTMCLGQIAQHHKLRVQPVFYQLLKRMPLADDPEAYPPYGQWMEQQADEVGYEFYLRAGFKPERAGTFFKAALRAHSNDAVDTCLTELQEPNPDAPERVDQKNDTKHPSSCFRIYDIHISETLKHSTIYKDLVAKAVITNLPETSGMIEALRKTYPSQP